MGLTLVSNITGIAAVLLLVLVQFLPWASADSKEDSSPGGLQFSPSTDTVHTWEYQSENKDGSGDFEMSWWDSSWTQGGNTVDGARQFRLGAAFLVLGLALCAAGTIVGFAKPSWPGPALTLAGGLASLVAIWAFWLGVSHFFDNSFYAAFEWKAAFFLGLSASTMALASATVGLVEVCRDPRMAQAP